MQKLLVVVILALGLEPFAPGQSTSSIPLIKGHRLGESFQDFMKNANLDTKKAIGTCQNDSQNQVCLAGHSELLNHPDEVPDSFTVSCGVDQGELQVEWCQELDGVVDFEQGKLIHIHVNLDGTWRDNIPGIIKKLGQPTDSKVIVKQNGFGAKFTFNEDLWYSKSYVAVLEQVREGLNFDIWTSEHIRQKDKEIKQRSAKPLD